MSLNLSHLSLRCNAAMAGAVPSVFVADADAEVRGSLESVIDSAGWRPRIVASADELLAYGRPTTPSCLLTELNLAGSSSGLELQERLSAWTELPVIFMSRNADVQSTVRAMKGGAFEFLTKPLRNDVLLKTLESALERSQSELRNLVRARALEERLESLSRREREVMKLVVAGRLNKQVGGELGISEITVKAHRGKMMRKMQAHSLAELVNIVANLRVHHNA